MVERFKTFSSIGELDKKERELFSQFGELNSIIEQDNNGGYDLVGDSYIKVMLDESRDFSDYSELDYQIKFLIEEKNIIVNKILDFAAYKYSTLHSLISLCLEESDELFSQVDKKELVKIIMKKKKGNIFIGFQKVNSTDNRQYPIHFNFEHDVELNYQKFKSEIQKFNISKIMKETGMIMTTVGI